MAFSSDSATAELSEDGSVGKMVGMSVMCVEILSGEMVFEWDIQLVEWSAEYLD
jgi:hypothetical protein